MEIQFLPFNFTAYSLFISFISLLFWQWNRQQKNERLPPSPWKLPLIGHMHHLIGGAPPHRALRNLSRKYGGLLHLNLGELSTIIVSSREAAKDVMKVHDPACADKGENPGVKIMWYDYTDIAWSPYNDYWRQMRKLCIMELLSTKNVRSFSSIRQDEASHLIRSIESSAGKPINLTEKIFSFTSSIICRAAFGQVLKDRDTLIALMIKGLALAGGFELADFFPSSKLLQSISWNKNRLWKLRRKLDSVLDSLIDEHKVNIARSGNGNGESGVEDIVDVLLRLQQSGELAIPITNDNIKAIIFDLFSAGTDTSSTTIDWAMAEMMRNPHALAKAQFEVRQLAKDRGSTFKESDVESLKFLKSVVKETLRLHPPFALIPRACRKECEANGYTIPVKLKLIINVWALGRDPNYWDEPEIFKPERFEINSMDFLGSNFEYIPFGAGRRICPGMNFGLANVELPLAQLLYHFDWKLPTGMNPKDLSMDEAQGISIRRKDDLFLIPTPYNPSIDC